MRRVFMTVLLLAAAAVSGEEKVIAKFNDVVLTPTKSKWSAETKSFRVFAKTAQKYRGKQVVFRMNAKRTAGDQALGATFRCSVKPGGLKATQNFRFAYTKNGDEVPIEAVITVPDLDNISQFNIQVGFNKLGKVPTVWEFKNVRFCEFDETAARNLAKAQAESRKTALPEGFSAEFTAMNSKGKLELVKGGKILCVIVLPDQPDNIAKFAAKELQDHFKLAVGSAPAIVPESEYKSGPAILVGDTAVARKYGIDPDMLVPEYALAARLNDVIVLSGGDRKGIPMSMVNGRSTVAVGTLYAAYEFLERVLGVRWYWPGRNGTHVPQVKDVAVEKLYAATRPVYDTRSTFYGAIKNDPDVTAAEGALWFRRNRFGGSVGSPIANHSFNTWPKRFAKTHPEYLALQADGTRKITDEPGGGHVCLTNPDVFKQMVQDKLDYFKKSTYSNFSAVMPGDGLGLFHCRCEACMKKVKPELGTRGSFSDLVWGFVNDVAAEVAKKAPGKVVTCCSYGSYHRKPSFPLLPNVAVTLCFSPVPRGTLSYKAAWKALLDEWSATGARLYVWEYWNNSRYHRGVYGAPAIFPRQLKEIYAMDAGIVSGRAIELSNVDGAGQSFKHWTDWMYDVQNLYVAGKLMWDLNADVEKILDEYYTNFFGPAAKPVRQFHEEMEAAWIRAGWEPGKWNFQRVWKDLYPPAFVDRMMGLLNEAVKLAGNQAPYAYRAKRLLNAYKPFDRNSRMFRGGKRATNPKAVSVPRVSGKPGPADWAKAAVLKDFCDAYNVYAQESKTEMRLLHDGKFLYIKADCTIPPLVSSVKWVPEHLGKRDAMLWSYESLEFFLARDKEIYQFILAPDDRLYDSCSSFAAGKKKPASWNSSKIVWSTKRGNARWEGYLAIPLDELRFKAEGKPGVYAFNAYRNCRYNMPGEPATWEQSCYLPVFGGFQKVEHFGTLKLQ